MSKARLAITVNGEIVTEAIRAFSHTACPSAIASRIAAALERAEDEHVNDNGDVDDARMVRAFRAEIVALATKYRALERDFYSPRSVAQQVASETVDALCRTVPDPQ